MNKKLLLSILLTVWFLPLLTQAEDVYPFDNDVDRERFQQFTEEMRCPKCQSQNLAGSDAPISQDLKRELHRLIAAGKTDDEVVDFMVASYGDYVLYKPRVEGTNLVLWLSPFILLLVGLSAFVWVVVKKQPPADEE